ncbi:MAG TPA: siphovirus Gp157 family protein [Bryobacteraceae bacterium]|nr:siphovirus Gp157 family protein [Bryobacteraceae bacterium]
MAALTVVPSPAVTAAPLYRIEEYLAALVETAELVPEDQEREFQAEFEAALTTAVEKRDRVGQFFAHLEQQIEFAKLEIERLRERKAAYERALDRLENYVVGTIEHLGKDARGKYRRLEGRTVTFSVRGCPPSVEVTDEPAVPAAFKALTIRLPATIWERMLDALDVGERAAVLQQVRNPEVAVDKRAVKTAIERGVLVAGAELITGRHSLSRS